MAYISPWDDTESGKPEAWTFARLEQMRQQYNEVPCLVVDQLLFFSKLAFIKFQ